VVAAASFCVVVLVGMDYWTVDSYRPLVRDLPGADPATALSLRDAGVSNVYAVADLDSVRVSEMTGLDVLRAGEIVRAARLARTRGIGTLNARALLAAGIDDLCALAAAEPADLTAAVRAMRHRPYAGRPARVRVWIRAARRECGAELLPAPLVHGILSSER